MCPLFITAKLNKSSGGNPEGGPDLLGDRVYPAASFDAALAKQPLWLVEMFGAYSNGAPVSRRLFVRSNPGFRRGGPC